jgi:hypothetical protein
MDSDAPSLVRSPFWERRCALAPRLECRPSARYPCWKGLSRNHTDLWRPLSHHAARSCRLHFPPTATDIAECDLDEPTPNDACERRLRNRGHQMRKPQTGLELTTSHRDAFHRIARMPRAGRSIVGSRSWLRHHESEPCAPFRHETCFWFSLVCVEHVGRATSHD